MIDFPKQYFKTKREVFMKLCYKCPEMLSKIVVAVNTPTRVDEEIYFPTSEMDFLRLANLVVEMILCCVLSCIFPMVNDLSLPSYTFGSFLDYTVCILFNNLQELLL